MWAYCLNNPILYSDTFGESVTICILGVTFSLVELVVAVAAIVIVADVLINGENSLLARAASSVAEAVETAAETNAEIWKAVEAVITHPERFTTGSGIIVGSGTLIGSIISIVEDKKDPDPYARPGQKKQNREVKEKRGKKTILKAVRGNDGYNHLKSIPLDENIKSIEEALDAYLDNYNLGKILRSI